MEQNIVIEDSNYPLHFLSGFIAVVLYILLIILIIGGFRFYKEMNYGDSSGNSDNVSFINLEESIELGDVNEQEQEAVEEIQEIPKSVEPIETKVVENKVEKVVPPQKITPKIEITKKEEVKVEVKVEEPKQKQPLNLDDIFSIVQSETQQERKAKENKKREEELALKRKQLEEEQKARSEKLAQNAAALQESTKALEQASKNLKENVKQAMTIKINIEKPQFKGNKDDRLKYDEWYGQIERLLMAEWQKTGVFQQQPTSAKVRIRVDGSGKLKFLFMINQSPYGEYNSFVIAFLHKMGEGVLPLPPNGDVIEFNVVLKSDLRF